MFHGLVEDVAGVEVWCDKDVGVAGDWGAGDFFLANFGVDGGIELHFAVDEPICVIFADFVDDGIDFRKIGIFATRTFGGIREHRDAWSVIKICFVSFGGVFDDSVELLFGGELIDATVGYDEGLVALFTDKTTREKLRTEGDMCFAGEEDVARGKIETRNETIDLTVRHKSSGGI